MQIWAESGKSALPICNYSQILYQFLTFTQNLKRSRKNEKSFFTRSFRLKNYKRSSLVIFYNTKSTFCLDGTVHSKQRPLDTLKVLNHFLMHLC